MDLYVKFQDFGDGYGWRPFGRVLREGPHPQNASPCCVQILLFDGYPDLAWYKCTRKPCIVSATEIDYRTACGIFILTGLTCSGPAWGVARGILHRIATLPFPAN